MTEQLGARFPQFYMTHPAPCPYLPDRQERKIFARLVGPYSREIHEGLARTGFRRSQTVAYRPACEGCSACISVRIPVSAFSPSRNLRKVIAGNTDLSAAAVGTEVTEEQFLLLKDYLDTRHHDGGMATMTSIDFAAMAGDTTVATQLVEYRLPPQHRNDPGQLVACALTDVMSDGLSMVYSFYDPDLTARSLGTYMVLHHIERARKSGLPYVYLGYLVEGCRKMSYKARFTPLEAYGADGWKPYDPPG